MALRKIKKDDPLQVDIVLEFEGTIHGSHITVESQVIVTNGSATKRTGSQVIKAEADPIQWQMTFNGEINSIVKKHELKINSRTFRGPDEIKFKTRQIQIDYLIPYIFFDLEEINVDDLEAPIAHEETDNETEEPVITD